ncbi:MAG: hypothetical protein ACTHK9_12575 [Nitrobacter sp.]
MSFGGRAGHLGSSVLSGRSSGVELHLNPEAVAQRLTVAEAPTSHLDEPKAIGNQHLQDGREGVDRDQHLPPAARSS